MSDLRKAAEMVLEAWGWDWSEPRNEALKERMEALRQALAQPEQEPVAWIGFDKDGDRSIAFEQKTLHEDDYPITSPLYIAPPKREWVGLTDEERVSFFTKSQNKFWDWDDGVDIEAFIRAIEAKLKEKNT